MSTTLRVVVVDDERPARSFLVALLRSFGDVDVVSEAADGAEAIAAIERERPDLALLDLQMPEVDGLGVVRLLRKDRVPLVAFVTAYDEFAVRAFELNAVDYLLKPVDGARLRDTINRAQERLERADVREDAIAHVRAAASDIIPSGIPQYLARIPVRHRDAIILVPVERVASIVADGELLNVTTDINERFVFSYRLKDLEPRLNPEHFVRLGRGAIANIEMITTINPLPGGTYVVKLKNDQQLQVSRLQSRILRERLLRL